jgi:hypothetical protein
VDRLRSALLAVAILGGVASCGLDLAGAGDGSTSDAEVDDASVDTAGDSALDGTPDAGADVEGKDADAGDAPDTHAHPPDASGNDAADASDAGDAGDAADAGSFCVTAQSCPIPTDTCFRGACTPCGDTGSKGRTCKAGGKCRFAPLPHCQ